MIHAVRPICCALALTLLAGCGNFMRQSRVFDTTGTGGITIDASQRAIYSVKKKYQSGAEWTAFCAEPSPDALSALASNFGVDASVASKALGVATNNLDSTASIGLRTQTIQILRDAMYRLCEGYASGALDKTGFTRLQRRYLHNMLALLAIEQITGPVVAQQVALTGSSKSGLGRGLAEIAKVLADAAGNLAVAQSNLTDAKAAVADLTKQLADAKTAGKPASETAEMQNKLDVATKKVSSKVTELTAAQTTYDSLEAKLKESDRMLLDASSSAQAFAPARSASAPGDAAIIAVSMDVRKIVKEVLNHDYTKDTCIDVMLSDEGDELVNARTFETIVALCGKAHNLSDDLISKMMASASARSKAVEEKIQRARVAKEEKEKK